MAVGCFGLHPDALSAFPDNFVGLGIPREVGDVILALVADDVPAALGSLSTWDV